jgi:hypothetical protein
LRISLISLFKPSFSHHPIKLLLQPSRLLPVSPERSFSRSFQVYSPPIRNKLKKTAVSLPELVRVGIANDVEVAQASFLLRILLVLRISLHYISFIISRYGFKA